MPTNTIRVAPIIAVVPVVRVIAVVPVLTCFCCSIYTHVVAVVRVVASKPTMPKFTHARTFCRGVPQNN